MHFELIVTFFIFSRKAKTLLKGSRKREISELGLYLLLCSKTKILGVLSEERRQI